MSLLEQSTKGKIKKPYFIFLWGAPGVGKSQMASDFPDPYFIDMEKGSLHLNVERHTELKTFGEVRQILKELEASKFKTIVIDTTDALEALIFQAVCDLDGSSSIDKAQGSFGKGYTAAVNYERTLINDDLKALRDKGKHIVLLGHSMIRTVNDPTMVSSYNVFAPKMNEKMAAVIMESVDAVLYATYETFLKTDKNEKKNRALGEGKRIMHTEFRPGFIAKNRYGLPPTLPLSFKDFDDAAQKGEPESLEVVLGNINSLLAMVSDADIRKKATAARDKAENRVDELSRIENRLRVLVQR